MRLIRKGTEPPLLLAYRKTQGAHYGGLPADAKAELRAALVRDERGLCCFCMQRIAATVAPKLKVKIAHWMPQNVDAARDLGVDAARDLVGAQGHGRSMSRALLAVPWKPLLPTRASRRGSPAGHWADSDGS